jgi:hypothetical protein
MKASQVRILKALDAGESYVDPTFLLVETTLDDAGEAVTTIERVASQVVDGSYRWKIETLGQSVPMSHRAALEWAASFAASRNIPVVYERNDCATANYAAALSAANAAGLPAAPK